MRINTCSSNFHSSAPGASVFYLPSSSVQDVKGCRKATGLFSKSLFFTDHAVMHCTGENTNMTQAENVWFVQSSWRILQLWCFNLTPWSGTTQGMSRALAPAGCPPLAHTHTATCVGMLVVDQGKMPAVHVWPRLVKSTQILDDCRCWSSGLSYNIVPCFLFYSWFTLNKHSTYVWANILSNTVNNGKKSHLSITNCKVQILKSHTHMLYIYETSYLLYM